MRRIDDDERRARLARRHGLTGGARTLEEVTAAMAALHATEAATVYLSLSARVPGVTTADIDRALYDDRTLVKQLAMRRTLFVFPRELLPAVLGSAAARTATALRSRMAKDLVTAGLADDEHDAEARIDAALAAVLDRLGDDEPLPSRGLRDELPALAGTMTVGPGKKWGGDLPIAPRLLTLFGADGHLVRARNAGSWHLSKPAWTTMERWLGGAPSRLAVDDGYAELTRRWLRTFGPGTEADLVWWLGATKAIVRRALDHVGAVAVDVGDGATGWVLPDDVEPEPAVEPWAALLPVLDPTVMGWKERAFYLDADQAPQLFDGNGNAGTTAWWNGRIVGCWVQEPDATVRLVLREDIGADALAALESEAERLTAWLNGLRISNVWASPLMKTARRP